GSSVVPLQPTATPTPAPSATPTPAPTPGADGGDGTTTTTPPSSTGTGRMSDVSEDQWAYEFIDGLVALGVVDGYPMDDGTFEYRPDNPITRAEMAKLLVETKELDLIYDYDGSAFADWDDVAEWAKPYVAAAVENGIMVGSAEEDGLYVLADDFIIREQMIAMAVRALEVAVPEGGEQGVSDFETVSDWAKDYVAFATENEMINVGEDGSVRPLVNATRAESAMILYMLIEYMEL
ncbi:MAG: S-layer homology domain-containing protein, partial [Oscillospiraceae bacterium]|nr:S-layer homology domain-containing protein [Oscillospiraceae bacterium]